MQINKTNNSQDKFIMCDKSPYVRAFEKKVFILNLTPPI